MDIDMVVVACTVSWHCYHFVRRWSAHTALVCIALHIRVGQLRQFCQRCQNYQNF